MGRGADPGDEPVPAAVRAWLHDSPALARFCTQNGWIDPDTLRAVVVAREGDELIVAVTFEEIVVEASGCVGTTIPCYGRVRFRLGGDGGGVRILEALPLD